MTDLKVSALPAIVGTPDDADLLYIVDTSLGTAGSTKLTWAGLKAGLSAAGLFVTGSGTANQVTTWASASAITGSAKLTFNATSLGVAVGATAVNTSVLATGTIADFFQMDIKNSSSGTGAQSGYSATADTGTATTLFAWMGINDSGTPLISPYNIGGALDTSFIGAGNDMYLWNSSTTKDMIFALGKVASPYYDEFLRLKRSNSSIIATVPGGLTSIQAATQDAVALLGRAGGTGSFVATITPTTLTASRTYTLPDSSITLSGSTAALVNGQIVVAGAGGLLSGASTFTYSGSLFTLNQSGAALAAGSAGTVVQIAAATGITRILVDSFGTSVHSSFAGRSARGTSAAPTALQLGDEISHVSGFGYGATGYSALARAFISIFAAENWTDTAQGTRIGLQTTAPGGIITSQKLVVFGDGGVSIGGSYVTSPGAGSLLVTGQVTLNQSGSALAAGTTGTVMQIAAATGITRILVDSFGTGIFSAFAGRSARGTVAAPTALQLGDEITHVSAFGYGATAYSASPRGFMSIFAAENWTDTAQGTRIGLQTTAPGGIVTSEKLRIFGDGGVSIGGTYTTSPGPGGLLVTGVGGIRDIQAATQDGIQIIGRAGGTSSFIASITPTTLTASRTYTLPDADITLAGSTGALTAGQVVVAQTSGLLGGNSAFTYVSNVLEVDAASAIPTLRLKQTSAATNSPAIEFYSGGGYRHQILEVDGAAGYLSFVSVDGTGYRFDKIVTLNLTSGNSLNVVSTTSAASSITGAVTIGNGAAATNVGIGGGNVNAGGSILGATLASVQGTITTAALNLSGTANWNAALTFTGWKLNITDTSSNAASMLMDLQLGGSTRFQVLKTGEVGYSVAPTVGGGLIQLASGTTIANGILLGDVGIFRNAANALTLNATAGLTATGYINANYYGSLLNGQEAGIRIAAVNASFSAALQFYERGSDLSKASIYFLPNNGSLLFYVRNATGSLVAGDERMRFVGSGGIAIGATAMVGSEALRVAGGTIATPTATDVLIGGGRLATGDTTDATSAIAASVTMAGGLAVAKSIFAARQTLTQTVVAGATAPTIMTLTGAAHTNLTLSTEYVDVAFAIGRIVQFATGAIATQRAITISSPTYAFVGASTITTAATVAIVNCPQVGTNATLTNSYALWVQAGMSRFDGNITVADPTTTSKALTFSLSAQSAATTLTLTVGAITASRILNVPVITGTDTLMVLGLSQTKTTPLLFTTTTTPLSITQGVSATTIVNLLSITAGAHTTLTLSTECVDLNFNLARIVQWATGALATQRFALFQAPTIAFVAASTVTKTATVAITGAPIAGTNATLTNSYALWVQTGISQFDGTVATTGARLVGTLSVTTAAGTTTGLSTDHFVCFTGSTTQIYTLPAASIGRWLVLKNRSTGAVTINRGGSDTIDGGTTYNLIAGGSILLFVNGTDWTIN